MEAIALLRKDQGLEFNISDFCRERQYISPAFKVKKAEILKSEIEQISA